MDFKKTIDKAEKMNENVYKHLESLARLGRDFCSIQNPKCGQYPMNKGCQLGAKNVIKKKGFFRI